MQPSTSRVVNPSNYPSDFLALKAYAVTLVPEQERFPVGTLQHFEAQFALRVVTYRLMKFQCPNGRDDDMITFIRLFETSFPELIFEGDEYKHTLCGCNSIPVPTEDTVRSVCEHLDEVAAVNNRKEECEFDSAESPTAALSDTSEDSDPIIFGDIDMQEFEDPQIVTDVNEVMDGYQSNSDESSTAESASSDGTACTIVTAVSPGGSTSTSAAYVKQSLLKDETIYDPIPMIKAIKEVTWRRGNPTIHDGEDITEIAVIYRSGRTPRYELRDEARTPIFASDSSNFTIHELEDNLAPLCYPKKQIWKIFFRLQELIKPRAFQHTLGISTSKHLQFLSIASVPVHRMLAKLVC